MTITEIVAYTLFATAGVTALYSILIAVEVKRGVRLGKKFRQYMDQKVIAAVRRMGKNAELINTLYERGSDEVEKDLIDPVTKPIVETQQQYLKLKTGEREIAYTGKRHASPHLRKITEMHNKKKKKKKRKKKNNKQEKHTPQEQQKQRQPQEHQQQKQQSEQQAEKTDTPTPPQHND